MFPGDTDPVQRGVPAWEEKAMMANARGFQAGGFLRAGMGV